ncbi:MAG: hypothetical protein ACNA7W_07170 [Pseudomonadales bacterium]
MIRMFTTAVMFVAATVFSLGSVSVHALEEDQVRGEIVEVDAEAGELTLRVEETGDERPERAGQEETYQLADDVEIRRGTVGHSIVDPLLVRLGDLGPGDEVTVSFEEVEGRRTARDVEVSDRDEATEAAPFEGTRDGHDHDR